MLAVMVAPTVGINPMDPCGLRRWSVLLPLVPQALPVSWWCNFRRTDCAACDGPAGNVVALLISVEPLIDMGRTALNLVAR